jgi:cysteinyl-tRNA synthetase
VRDLLEKYDGEVLRFPILSGHYRGPIDFNPEILTQSENGLKRMRNAKSNLKHLIATSQADGEGPGCKKASAAELQTLASFDPFREKFISAMDDDLNTADAISAVFELITAINTAVKDGASRQFAQGCMDFLMELCTVLGLLQQEVEETVEIEPEIQALIDERQAARKAKDFARADEIRDQLKAQGITLKDTPQGVQVIRD